MSGLKKESLDKGRNANSKADKSEPVIHSLQKMIRPGASVRSLAAGSPSVAEATYLQLGIRGIDESISQNRVPVLNVGTTGN